MRSEPVDPRIFYWTYTVAACLGGFILAAWGPLWLGAHLQDMPWGKAALLRVAGVVVIAAGLFAGSLATMPDPLARRATNRWFAGANAIVILMLLMQQYAVVGVAALPFASELLMAVVLLGVLLGVEHDADGRRYARITTLFGGVPRRAHANDLRSQYEEQIREAAAQEERNRLARDLHDSIKQQVFAIQTAAATAQARFDGDPSGAKAALEQIRDSAREAMTEMEAMLDQLRAVPLENVGLVEALRRQCEALGFRLGARVEFRPGALPPSGALPPGAHHAMLRVAQEALANVGRHSRATRVQVTVDSAAGRLEMKIADNGAGFDPNDASGGMGLENMRQRAWRYNGDLSVCSRPGGGTTVQLSLPYATWPVHAGRHLALAICWAVAMVAYFLLGLRDIPMMPLTLAFLPLFIREVHLYLRARRIQGAH